MGAPTFVPGRVRVRVPATSANLGPGFDALGLALGLYDEVEVRLAPGGLSVTVRGEGAGDVPTDESHLVVRALRATLDRLGGQPPGLALTCTNRVPHGRGLGSSAAAIVAGVLAGRALVESGASGMDDTEALALATELEGHPDNVAACLRGGLTIAWMTDSNIRGGSGRTAGRAVRLEPARVQPVVFVPRTELSTRTARGLLPGVVPHADAAANAGRAALLVAALTGTPGTAGPPAGPVGASDVLGAPPAGEVDLALLLAATEDRLHQDYRAPAMPESAHLVADLRERGHPAVISGAGPTVLAFARPGGEEELRARAPEGWAVYVLPVDRAGGRVTWTAAGE
ncbi:homoserine kinase [Actinopolymorpha singaporensis]|uniref:Homoserine kinase n=1 Tax=Actinopolymorpha singaporensis TaxID=117157 RepID=A0A1H1YK71_9ACTN|nr:homoserine kinase [Actinopolymorpha singaporensis]SDT21751.1 homoserine kinase [Actinopolymorpha singaporensis]